MSFTAAAGEMMVLKQEEDRDLARTLIIIKDDAEGSGGWKKSTW